MGLAILLGVFGISVVLGVPVAFAMGISAAAAFWYEGFPLLMTFQRIHFRGRVLLAAGDPLFRLCR